MVDNMYNIMLKYGIRKSFSLILLACLIAALCIIPGNQVYATTQGTQYIGLSTPGENIDTIAVNYFLAVKATASEDLTIDTLSLYVAENAAGKVRLGIYSHNNFYIGYPYIKLAETEEISLVNGWNSGAIEPVTLTAGTQYWLAFVADDDAAGTKITYNSQDNALRFSEFTYSALPEVIEYPFAEHPSPGQFAIYGYKSTVNQMVISEDSAVLEVGGSMKLNVTVLPSNAANKRVIWSTSDPTVATVDETGTVKALKEGQVIITATSEDNPTVKVNCSITVQRVPIQPPTTPPSQVTPPSVTDVATKQEGNITTVSTVITAIVDKQTGSISASLGEDIVSALVDATNEAGASGQKPVIEIRIESTEDAEASEIEISRGSFRQIADETDADLKVDAIIGTIIFNQKAIASINDATPEGDVNIAIQKVDNAKLPEQIQKTVGDRLVYDFSLKVGEQKISDFGGGKVEICIPYTPEPDEKEEAIVVYYVDDSGALQTVRGRYDSKTGLVKFTVTHFSKYVIGYNEVIFNDVDTDAWYNSAVSFAAARGIVQGMGGGRFAPEESIKRADFLIIVMNSFGIELDEHITQNFIDAGDKYYTPYLGTAKRIGLVLGMDGNRFAPEEQISRQDMLLILYRALIILDELPEGSTGRTLQDFADAEDIEIYAKEAINHFVETGIIEGSEGRLLPKATSTRAQAAQVLYNLLTK